MHPGWVYLQCADMLHADGLSCGVWIGCVLMGLKNLLTSGRCIVCVLRSLNTIQTVFKQCSNSGVCMLRSSNYLALFEQFLTVFEQHTTQVVSPTEVFEHCLNIFAPMD